MDISPEVQNTQDKIHRPHEAQEERRQNYGSLVSLNINGFNSPIKRHRLADWIHKQDPASCCIQEIHLNEIYLRVKGWKTIFQENGPKKQAGDI